MGRICHSRGVSRKAKKKFREVERTGMVFIANNPDIEWLWLGCNVRIVPKA